jgi:hypothetical protein
MGTLKIIAHCDVTSRRNMFKIQHTINTEQFRLIQTFVPKCPSAQVPKSPSAQVPKCPRAQLPNCPSDQVHKC